MKAVAVLLVFACALVACDQAPKPEPAPAPDIAVTNAIPKEQTDFVAFIRELKDAPGKAASEAEAEALPKSAPNTFCTAYADMQGFDDWRAKVFEVRISLVDGSMDITFDLGSGVLIESVLPASDPTYPALVKLKGGENLILSGTFSHARDGADCLYYRGPYAVVLTKVQRNPS